MKMPRVRFSLRRLMIATVITGFALDGAIVQWRWTEFNSVVKKRDEAKAIRLAEEQSRRLSWGCSLPVRDWDVIPPSLDPPDPPQSK